MAHNLQGKCTMSGRSQQIRIALIAAMSMAAVLAASSASAATFLSGSFKFTNDYGGGEWKLDPKNHPLGDSTIPTDKPGDFKDVYLGNGSFMDISITVDKGKVTVRRKIKPDDTHLKVGEQTWDLYDDVSKLEYDLKVLDFDAKSQSLDHSNKMEPRFIPFDPGDLRLMDTTYTIAPVPEPSAWVMLIAGFGLLGLSARRRRALVAI